MGKTKTVKDASFYEEYRNNSRVDIIAQNGNDGEHSEEVDAIRYVEEHYPEMTKSFQEIQFEQYELFCRKQYNYGKGNIMLGGDIDKPEDRKMALSGIIIRMNDKLNRLLNLVLKRR